MALEVRRVVTGHNQHGRSVVLSDDVIEKVTSRREGQSGCVVWTTLASPADNMDDTDHSHEPVATCVPDGTVFRLVEYLPGVEARIHRSDSLDYAIVVSGEICMELDEEEVLLRAGDVLVQRGTMHNWSNRSTTPCMIAFILIGAIPMTAHEKSLSASADTLHKV